MELPVAPICCPWLVPVLPLMKLSVTENFPVLLLRTLVRIVFWVDSATGNMNQSIFGAGHLLIGRSELENEDGSKETQHICFWSFKTFCSTLGSKRHIIDWSKCKSNISRSYYLRSHHDNQPRSNFRNVLCNNLCDVTHTYKEGNSDLVIWQRCIMWRSIIMSDHLYAKAGTLNIRFHARETLTSYFQ